MNLIFIRRNIILVPYILRSQLIWSLHFGNNQFGLYYFQSAINLIITVNVLTENVYVANGLHSWHIKAYVANKLLIKKI